nr:alpha/beta hydrolase [Nocardioides perillae]
MLTAALAANAVRPLRGPRVGLPAFGAGWLTSELAPHVLALTAVDTTAELVRHRPSRRPERGGPSRAGLALAAASSVALAGVVRGSLATGRLVEEALVEGLGVDYVEQLDTPPTPAELRVPWRRVAQPHRLAEPGVRVERDIAYAEGGRRLSLDVYRPEQPVEGAPVLVQVHGGAWTVGSKRHQGLALMHRMAAKGWVCVAVNYRLAPRHPWPAQVVDVKRALAWVKEHVAAYGGDPDYVAITGGSAGGHLAALAALTPGDPAFQPGFEDADTSVQACVPFYGVYDLAGATGLRTARQMRDGFFAPRVARRRWRDAPEVFEAASPILRVTPDAPDFLVLHGVVDTLVQVDQARLFVEELRRTSRRSVTYVELPGTQHAFDTLLSIRSAHVVCGIDRWLHWHWAGWRHGRTPVAEAAELRS